MDLQQKPLTGILPVLPTPFDPSGAVQADDMRRLTRFALGAGVDGLVFPGFASEVSELTGAERQSLLALVVEEAAGQVPIVAGASAPTAEDVIAHARHAQSLGLRHIMVQPPLSIGNALDAVLGFFKQICAALPDTRIVLQNAPAPRGSDIAPETLVEICKALPQVVYIKEETLPAGPAISYIAAHGPDTLEGVIGGGGARFILDEYARGACAAMPALEIADLHVQMDQAWREGRPEEARALYVRTLPLLVLQSVYRMNLTKYALQQRGVLTVTGIRAPTPDLDTLALRDIDQNLAELGLVTKPEAKTG